jgi:excisionase family DNA binding protein
LLWQDANDEPEVANKTSHPDAKDLVDLDVPVEEIPALLVKLAAAQARLQLRLLMHRAQSSRNEESETLLEAKDVADWLGVKEDYVRDLGRRGEIPTVKIGKYVRFERDSIREWIAQQRESIDGDTAQRLLGRR